MFAYTITLINKALCLSLCVFLQYHRFIIILTALCKTDRISQNAYLMRLRRMIRHRKNKKFILQIHQIIHEWNIYSWKSAIHLFIDIVLQMRHNILCACLSEKTSSDSIDSRILPTMYSCNTDNCAKLIVWNVKRTCVSVFKLVLHMCVRAKVEGLHWIPPYARRLCRSLPLSSHVRTIYGLFVSCDLMSQPLLFHS